MDQHLPASHSIFLTPALPPLACCSQAALADARRHEHTSKALSWELDNMRKLRDDSLSELTQQNSMLKHQLKVGGWDQQADPLLGLHARENWAYHSLHKSKDQCPWVRLLLLVLLWLGVLLSRSLSVVGHSAVKKSVQ
jgi:hypothetical protein